MASQLIADNGAVSGISGLRYSSDPSGALQIVTGAGVVAGTFGADQSLSLVGPLNQAAAVSIASAATTDIGAAASNSVTVTGSTTITSFGTTAAGAIRNVTFANTLTLTYNASSLILPGAASITTAAGDVAMMQSLGSGNWKCLSYTRASGAPVTKYDYVSASNPSYNTNPAVPYAVWYNTSTKTTYVCIDNTTNANAWRVQSALGTTPYTFDFFGDSSAVACWTMDSAPSPDLGGAYPMTGDSGTTIVAGIVGNASTFASTHQQRNGSPNNNLVVSVSAWVRLTDTGNNWIWTSGKTVNGTCRRGIRLSNLNVVGGPSYLNEYGAITGVSVPSGQWTHICTSGNQVYKNGVLAATIAGYVAPVSDTYGFYIGANGAYDYGYVDNETYGMPMNGTIDQVRVFNRVLTATEVLALYKEGTP